MLKGFHEFGLGIKELVFPHVCEICGNLLSDTSQFICQPCLQSRFELARISGEANNPDILLPEGISFQFALWKFDKGGYLQELLHKLKYHRLFGVGEDLGRALGTRMKHLGFLNSTEHVVLVPVPLHRNKERKRGFNQAYYLAKGVATVLKLPIIPKGAVRRVKNTQTQTGFNLEKRRENMKKAFEVASPHAFPGKTCMIVDDVFTTGATSFELASVLLAAGAEQVVIATIAEA